MLSAQPCFSCVRARSPLQGAAAYALSVENQPHTGPLTRSHYNWRSGDAAV